MHFLRIAMGSICPVQNTRLKCLPRQIGVCVLLFVRTNLGWSQGLKFNHLLVKRGQAEGNMLAIKQDKFCFIWIATEDGLNMFDGYTFTIFRNSSKDSSSINSNNVYCITEDKVGNFWI